jgi:hypothetical protein
MDRRSSRGAAPGTTSIDDAETGTGVPDHPEPTGADWPDHGIESGVACCDWQ